MSDHEPSKDPLTDNETELDLDFSNDSNSIIETHDSYLAAKRALFKAVEDAMLGDIDSAKESDEIIEELIAHLSCEFANTVATEDDVDARVRYAATLLYGLQVELRDFVESFATGTEFDPGNYEDTQSAIERLLRDSNPDDHEVLLIRSTDEICTTVLSDLLRYAPYVEEPNFLIDRKTQYVDRAKNVAITTAKIALKATVFAVVNHALSRKFKS